MESPRGNSVIQFKRCARSTAFYGDPKRELCHSIQKVCQEHDLLWRAQEGALSFNSIQKVCQEHDLLWRAQEGTLPFDSKGVPGARPSKGVPGARPSMESSRGSSVIRFKRCARSTAFLPKIMESPRGSSVIIMEFRKTHLA